MSKLIYLFYFFFFVYLLQFSVRWMLNLLYDSSENGASCPYHFQLGPPRFVLPTYVRQSFQLYYYLWFLFKSVPLIGEPRSIQLQSDWHDGAMDRGSENDVFTLPGTNVMKTSTSNHDVTSAGAIRPNRRRAQKPAWLNDFWVEGKRTWRCFRSGHILV